MYVYHQHSHSQFGCTHSNLKLCSVCGYVYCPDCGKEWSPVYQYYTTSVTWASDLSSSDGTKTININNSENQKKDHIHS